MSGDLAGARVIAGMSPEAVVLAVCLALRYNESHTHTHSVDSADSTLSLSTHLDQYVIRTKHKNKFSSSSDTCVS